MEVHSTLTEMLYTVHTEHGTVTWSTQSCLVSFPFHSILTVNLMLYDVTAHLFEWFVQKMYGYNCLMHLFLKYM